MASALNDVVLTGDGAANRLEGGPGNDTLDGGAGADTMIGGPGDDIYYVDNAGDVVTELANEGTDSVYTKIDYTLPANVENLAAAPGVTGALALTGNAAANRITLGSGGGTALGLNGDDVLVSDHGSGLLDGGAGNDVANLVYDGSGIQVALADNGDLVFTTANGTVTTRNVETVNYGGSTLITSFVPAINAQYSIYAGRPANLNELSAWSAALNSGTSTATMRTTILGALGQTYIDGQITQLYQIYGGRAPTANEISGWESALHSTGYDFSVLRTAILKDPLGLNYTAHAISESYQTLAGRAPVGNEIAAWQDVFRSGGTVQLLRQALLNDAGVQSQTSATVTTIYQSYAGRSPTLGELSAAKTMLISGSDFAGVRAAILDTPAIHGYEVAQISAAYQTYGGRAPTSGEISAWDGALHAGATYATIRDAILNTTMGTAYTDAQIDAAYQTYGGRHAQANELTAWENFLNTNNHNYTVVRDAILNTSLGTTYTDARINASYQTYAGRAANAGEITAWENFLNTNNHNYTAVRDAILNTSLGTAYTDARVDAVYQTYGGRHAQANELTAWENFLNTNNHNYAVVRDAVLSSSLGTAYTDAQITAAYQTYGGRAPVGNELQAWEGVLNGNGHDFSVVRTAILNTSFGDDNSTVQISGLYQRYFGRAPTADEQTAWHGAIRDGIDFDQLRDALMSSPGSAGTTAQIDASAGSGSGINAKPFVVISNFDPAHDRIDLTGAGYSSIDPLDANHARQIYQIDGTPDVLIAFDANHEILLHDVTLSQLSSSDFLL